MLIAFEDLGRTYTSGNIETRALRGITLAIERGEYVAVEGPSGCGKSTLLAILGLLESPTSGEYRFKEKPVARLSEDDRARIRNREIGFVFQNFNLVGDLSIAENVELPLVYAGMTRRERGARVAAVLERVNMSHRAGHYPAQLSGGQQQRVAVARALAGDPALLLADEPTGNLDSANGQAVMDLLADLHADGSTIVMVTHDSRFAKQAQRTIHLLDGQLAGESRVTAVHERV